MTNVTILKKIYWERFCKQNNESRKLEAIPWNELNQLLCAFFKDVRKDMATNRNLEL